jgi:hypothetical protein
MRRKAEVRRQPVAAPPRRDSRPPDLSSSQLLSLHASAGNAAVAQLLTGRPTVQRHAGIDPAAAAHIPTAAEQKDMPSVAEAPGLKTEAAELQEEWKEVKKRVDEWKPPTTDDEKKKLEATQALEADKKRLKEIENRVVEIKRKLKVRIKGDEEETLTRNGIKGGAAAWFADVKPMTFLGKPATVHKLLADRLRQAESALKSFPTPDKGWVQEGHSTLRAPGESLHSFGLAIDLNPGTNPWLVRPTGVYEPAKWTSAYLGAIEHALLLVRGEKLSDDPFFDRPKEADKDKRVEASYDKMKKSSDALAEYFTLADKDKLPQLQAKILQNDPKGKTKDWLTKIKADKKAVVNVGASKSWKNPQKGFLNLDKQLVKAMTASTGAGLTWLGDDTIAGRDIMHFDTRGVGPIKAIWNSANKTFTGLGNG